MKNESTGTIIFAVVAIAAVMFMAIAIMVRS